MSSVSNRAQCMLSASVIRELQDTASQGPERCGLLFGTSQGERWIVERAIELANRHSADDGFEIDIRDLALHAREQRAIGLELLGAWHTHPVPCADLSQRDLDGTAEDWLSLVVASDRTIRAFEHGPAGTADELEVVSDQAQRPK